MNIEIENNKFDFEANYGTVTNAIYRLVHIYASLISNRKNWLSSRETEFYTALLLTHYMGVDYTSSDADYIFEAVFGKLPVNRRKDYLDKIIKRGWAKLDESKSLVFPEVFSNFDMGMNAYEFNINLFWGD